MTSLLILVGTAVACLLRLWLEHRRVLRNNYDDIDSYGATLRKLSAEGPVGSPRDIGRPEPARPPRDAVAARRPPPLDPTRPEAGLRRTDVRRRGAL